MFLIFLFLCIIIGGWPARMDGGGWPKTHEWVERTLCMIPAVGASVVTAGWYAPLAYSGVLGIITGHGQYFLARMVKAISPERVDFIVRLFFGEDPRTSDDYELVRGEKWSQALPYHKIQLAREMEAYGMRKLYWRCVFGMFITGFVYGLPAAILAAMFGHWFAAAMFASTGIAKALAYMIGYALFKNTESAEWMNGTFRAALALVVIGGVLEWTIF